MAAREGNAERSSLTFPAIESPSDERQFNRRPPEPPQSVWRDRATYDERLRTELLAPLEQAARRFGKPPRALQMAVLEQLQWYFIVDGRLKAPTVILDETLAKTFHAGVAEVMLHIEAERLDDLPAAASPEVRQALLSYKTSVGHSTILIDAYDHEQGLVRLTYWIHGDPPTEHFSIDGVTVEPAFAKYRACRYFRRDLLRQRIVWLPVSADATSLEAKLNGAVAIVAVGGQVSSARGSRGLEVRGGPNCVIAEARKTFPQCKGAQMPSIRRWIKWKVALVKSMAALPVVRARFRDAWVFVDRSEDADDNAEHLYRWVRREHPEINAWFLLRPGTQDWRRLQQEGFRLMPPGVMRKLLLLNCRHIISSHLDFSFGGFERSHYGNAMRWRFTYLTHGVTKDDMSHVYANRDIDCLITPSPPAHAAFVSDDSPYSFTDREVRLCNLPRYDRLLRLAERISAAEEEEVLVMPTWRASLVDDRFGKLGFAERLRRVESSEYIQAWKRFLNDGSVRRLVEASGKRLVFFPHANVVPYLSALEVPSYVEVAAKGPQSIQEHLVKCCALVTDYSSIAFDVALLRRAVFYYQFDRDRFYGGDHNWRPGHFDYDRDGFGPVAKTHADLVRHLSNFFEQDCSVPSKYISRMECALPDRRAGACGRVFNAIASLRGPLRGEATRSSS